MFRIAFFRITGQRSHPVSDFGPIKLTGDALGFILEESCPCAVLQAKPHPCSIVARTKPGFLDPASSGLTPVVWRLGVLSFGFPLSRD